MSQMFAGCTSLQTVPLFNTIKVTVMNNMFQSCPSLQTVPLFNTIALTAMSSMFSGCSSLQTVPALNANTITNSASYGNMFQACPSLSEIKMINLKFTCTVANCKLSATALNEIYTNLPTVTGQSINVTGNHGTSTDNPAIAQAKGWSVTG